MQASAGAYVHQCQAVLADLRHLEEWFAHLDKQRTEVELSTEEEQVSVACGKFRLAVQAIGDQLQRKHGPHVLGDSGTASGSIRAPLPDFEEIGAFLSPMPWPESAQPARDWIIGRWTRGEGDAATLHQLRTRADAQPAFGAYHVLSLELLSLLRENRGDSRLQALGVSTLAEHLLSAANIPPAVAEHYRASLLPK